MRRGESDRGLMASDFSGFQTRWIIRNSGQVNGPADATPWPRVRRFMTPRSIGG